MSVTAVASFRPLPGRCLRHAAASGVLSVRAQWDLASTTTTVRRRAVVLLPPQCCQRRCQSRSSTPPNKDQPPRQDRPPMTFRQFAGRALGASLRNVAVAISPRGIRCAYRDAPALTSMNMILLAFLAVISAVAIRSYILTFYNSEISRYPEPVANTLRRALYYTNYKPDPELALKYYKLAMEQVAEAGLDPFSDEVLGIRIQVSAWLEKINSYKAATDVLESVLHDCNKWIAVMEQSVPEPKKVQTADMKKKTALKSTSAAAAPPANELTAKTAPRETQASAQTASTPEMEAETETERPWRKRQRLLAKAIGTAVKLGELYTNPHVDEAEKSHTHLSWAAETCLQEFARRATDGPHPGEQAFLSRTDLGAVMESLARSHERRSEFHLAIPLFFQALKVCESPCHRAVLMNNLAACFAQQPASDATTVSSLSESLGAIIPDQSSIPQTRTECLHAALNWAQNAHLHSQDVPRDARTPECDAACAVSLCNWGDVVAMLGEKAVARQKYSEAMAMSERVGFSPGAEQARGGLARLSPSP